MAVFIQTARAGGTPYDASWDITLVPQLHHMDMSGRGKKAHKNSKKQKNRMAGGESRIPFCMNNPKLGSETVFTVCGFPQALQLKIRTIPNVTPRTFLFMFSVITVH